MSLSAKGSPDEDSNRFRDGRDPDTYYDFPESTRPQHLMEFISLLLTETGRLRQKSIFEFHYASYQRCNVASGAVLVTCDRRSPWLDDWAAG